MENQRFEQRHKKRQSKLNRVYNVLIVLVAVLIVFVGGQMMFGNSEAQESTKTATASKEEKKTDKQDKEDSMSIYEEAEDESMDTTEDELAAEEENLEEENAEEAMPEESEPIIEENTDPSSDTARTITDPSWQPIGTQQSEPHAATYDKGSVDWNEMLQAVSYATGVGTDDMTVWRIGNNGGPNKAVATISSKTDKKKYRVQIDWVENEGWKPVVVEELKQ
ncbi:MAG TPA: YrrS family protein [Bacillus sp. (in: firmicutes)]|nr:YrrS family protein [Bacillus sp. (in: firmicutes)]